MKNFKKTLALALAAAVSVSTVFVASPAEAQAASSKVSVTLKAKAGTAKKKTLKGKGKTLTIAAKYNNGKVNASKLEFRSSKTSVATVSKKGVVTTKAPGTTTVTVKYTLKKKTYSAKVKVTVKKVAATSVTTKAVTVAMGNKKTSMSATVKPASATDAVTWKSSNTKVVRVNKTTGKLTPVKVGTAKVTATAGKTSKKVTVTVRPKSVTITGNKSITVGDSITLTGKASSTGGTIKWTTDNKKVATISKTSGSKTVVKGVKAGTAKITANVNGTKKTVKIKVTAKATVAVTGVSVKLGANSLVAGKTTTATATITPSNATTTTVTWSSSNTKAATVDKNGKVTAVAAGTADIIATSNNKKTGKATITVTAATKEVTGVNITSNSNTVAVGGTITITAEAVPSDATTDKTITYSSKATNVATVNETTGVVTGVSAGTAEIVATSKNGKTASVTVTVTAAANGARTFDGVYYTYDLTSASKVSKGSKNSVVPVVDLIKSDVEKLATKTNKAWTADSLVSDLSEIFAKSGNSALLKKAGTSLFAAGITPSVTKVDGTVKVVIGTKTYENITVDDSDASVHKLTFTAGTDTMTAEVARDASAITIKSGNDVVYSFKKTTTGYEFKLRKSAYDDLVSNSILAEDFVNNYTVSK